MEAGDVVPGQCLQGQKRVFKILIFEKKCDTEVSEANVYRGFVNVQNPIFQPQMDTDKHR